MLTAAGLATGLVSPAQAQVKPISPQIADRPILSMQELLKPLGPGEPVPSWFRQPVVERSPSPRHAPDDDPGLRRAFNAFKRAELREAIGWDRFPEPLRAAYRDIAIGPDQLNAGRGVTFTEDWLYDDFVFLGAQYGDRVLNDLVLHNDGDVTAIGTSDDAIALDSPWAYRIELQGSNDASQGWTENWVRPERLDNFLTSERGAADILGNTVTTGRRAGDEYYVVTLSGVNGANMFPLPRSTVVGLSTPTPTDIAVDGEGLIYVCGSGVVDGNPHTFVTRHRPDNGEQDWVVVFDTVEGPGAGLEVDRNGNIYVGLVEEIEGEQRVTTARLSPFDGAVVWQVGNDSFGSLDSGDADTLKLDRDGAPYIAYRGASGSDDVFRIRKLDPATGTEVWRAGGIRGVPNDLEIDSVGNVYVSGSTGADGRRLVKFDQTGQEVWRYTQLDPTDGSVGTLGPATDLALDRFDNPYITGPAGTAGNGYEDIQVSRHDPATGEITWAYRDQPVGPNVSNFDTMTTDLIVDAGGSVYASGTRTGRNDNTDRVESLFYVLKLGQPYVAVPQVYESAVSAAIENGQLFPNISNSNNTELFDVEFPTLGVSGGIVDDINNILDPKIGFAGVEIKSELKIKKGDNNSTGLKDAEVTVKAAATVQGGTYDADLYGMVKITVPSEDTINAGSTIPITVDWDPDELATQLTSRVDPDIVFEILGRTKGRLDVDLKVTYDLPSPGGEGTIVNTGLVNESLSSDGFQPLLSVSTSQVEIPNKAVALAQAGEWKELDPDDLISFFNGKVRKPRLTSEGSFDEATSTLSSSVDTKFIDTRIRATEAIVEALNAAGVPAPPLFYKESFSEGPSGFRAKGSLKAGLIQLIFDNEVFATQDIDLEITPYLTLEFSSDDADMVPASQTRNLVDSDGAPTQRTFDVRMPIALADASASQLTVTPRFGATATITTTTGVRLESSSDFETVQIKATMTVDLRDLPFLKQYDILDKDRCFECRELFNNYEGGSLTDSGSVDFSTSENGDGSIAPFQIIADNDIGPKLSGASVEALRMLIYDQRSPSLADFNALAGGTTPVILYGDNFDTDPFDGMGPDNDPGGNERVWLEYYGRREEMDRTVTFSDGTMISGLIPLNNEAILVEVPNRFLLLPGTLRAYVQNDFGRTENIEIDVEYPYPNVEGVEEVFWASEPRWATDLLTLVDGGTPAGNDSYLARRDYYRYLNDNLWNAEIMAGVDNTGRSGRNHFREFPGWSNNVPPAFPSIQIDGVPLTRDGFQFTDGKARFKTPESLTALSDFVNVTVVNPEPGGGLGRTVSLEIPAPQPVAQLCVPSLLFPGETTDPFVEISVLGPDTVPFDSSGNPNSEKYGNFTPRSEVLIDGVPVLTEFISSGEIVAMVPAAIANEQGSKVVEVWTPNPSDTGYTDSVTGQRVASGGLSDPITLDVAWPAPEVTSIGYDELVINTPPETALAVDDDVMAADGRNFVIEGENFAPGCEVYIQGRLADSLRVSSGVLRPTMTSGDLRRRGDLTIFVVNPEPNPFVSNPYIIPIVFDIANDIVEPVFSRPR